MQYIMYTERERDKSDKNRSLGNVTDNIILKDIYFKKYVSKVIHNFRFLKPCKFRSEKLLTASRQKLLGWLVQSFRSSCHTKDLGRGILPPSWGSF